MNKIEVALGVLTILFSLSAIALIFTGVGMSAIIPGRYAWEGATRAYYFMAFLPVLGIATMVHGLRRSKTSESVWGVITLVWSFFSWWWVGLNIYDGASFFKGGFADTVILTAWPLIVFIFSGIALMVDVACEKPPVRIRNAAELSEKNQNAKSW